MPYRDETETASRLPSLLWLAVLIAGAGLAAYATFVVLNLMGLR
jgi:hypothetical protein